MLISRVPTRVLTTEPWRSVVAPVVPRHAPRGYVKGWQNVQAEFARLSCCSVLYARSRLVAYRNGWPIGLAAGITAREPAWLEWYAAPAERALSVMHNAAELELALSFDGFSAAHELLSKLQFAIGAYLMNPSLETGRALVAALVKVIARLNLILHAACRRHGLRA